MMPQKKEYQKKNKIINGFREGNKVKGVKIYQIKFFRELGMTYFKIAARLGLGTRAVLNWCKKMGVKPKNIKPKKGERIKTKKTIKKEMGKPEEQKTYIKKECNVINCDREKVNESGLCEEHLEEFENDWINSGHLEEKNDSTTLKGGKIK
jgi:hypothetical protein